MEKGGGGGGGGGSSVVSCEARGGQECVTQCNVDMIQSLVAGWDMQGV